MLVALDLGGMVIVSILVHLPRVSFAGARLSSPAQPLAMQSWQHGEPDLVRSAADLGGALRPRANEIISTTSAPALGDNLSCKLADP